MTTEEKKHKRKFEFKKRGDAAFLEKHSGLARAVAAESGKLVIQTRLPKRADGSTLEHKGGVVILERPMGMDTKHKPDSELVSLVKAKQASIKEFKAGQVKKCKRTAWGNLRRFVQDFDNLHKTQLWPAFQVWIGKNPSFQSQCPRKRLAIASSVIQKMLDHVATHQLMVNAAKRMEQVNGNTVTCDLSKVAGYNELVAALRVASNEQVKVNVAASKAANTHYDYGMV